MPVSISPLDHICTDLSHPPIIRNITQETLYQRVSNLVAEHKKAGVSDDEIVRQVASELIPELTKPSKGGFEGFRLQQMRQQIARDWGEVFYKLDNLGYLTGWFINECISDGDELHFVLCLFALEAIRNMFATVNQLRSALTQDTFGYWRTLYETLVKSRFILKFSEKDPDLVGKFSYYTNSCYLKFYSKFAPESEKLTSSDNWTEAEKFYADRYKKEGKGDYGWAYPHIRGNSGKSIKRPTFRQLVDAVDKGSHFSDIYYDVATAKSHGQFVWSPLMIRPVAGRGTNIDAFNVGNIGLVLDLMMPLFKEILENTAPSCNTPAHGVVMDIVKAIIKDISNSVARIKASNPDMHGSFDP